MLVANLNALAILGFLETNPDIFRHFGMRKTPQLPLQRLEGRRRKLLQRPADDPRAFRFRQGLQFAFQDVRPSWNYYYSIEAAAQDTFWAYANHPA